MPFHDHGSHGVTSERERSWAGWGGRGMALRQTSASYDHDESASVQGHPNQSPAPPSRQPCQLVQGPPRDEAQQQSAERSGDGQDPPRERGTAAQRTNVGHRLLDCRPARAHVGTVPRRKATEAAHATPACSSAMGRGKAVEALPPQVFWERLWRLRRPTTVI